MAESSNDSTQKFGLDATDYFTAVDNIVRKNRSMADSLVQLGTKILSADKLTNQISSNFRNLKDAPEGFAAALKLLGGEYDKVGDKIVLNNKLLQANVNQIKNLADAYDNDLMRSVEAYIKAEEDQQKAIRKTIDMVEAKGRVVTAQATRGTRRVRFQGEDQRVIASVAPIQGNDEVAALEQANRERIKQSEKAANDLGRAMEAQSIRFQAEEKIRLKKLADEKAAFQAELASRNRVIRPGLGGVATRGDQIIGGLGSPEVADLQSKAEVRAVGQGIKDKQALRLQEANSLGKMLEAQARAYESEQKQETKAVAEQLVARNRLQAAYFKAQQQLKLDLPTFGDQGKKGQVIGNIGKISDLIGNGQISSKRANEVMKSVTEGSSEIFTGSEAKVASFTRSMNAANAALQNVGTGAKDSLKSLGQGFEEAETKGKQSAEAILLSWRGMARLFVVQLLHTGVREFINSLQQAIDTSAKWQVKISEIRTITQDQPQSMNEWAQSVRKLSDEFGNPILEVTEGLYETISNQVGKGATAVNFMSKALQFGKVTGASTADSVNLLSSALNSFGLDVSQTERVASTFFAAIDKGRLRAADIANTFGRVGPSAKNLGVSLEEVAGSLATLTIKGVPPADAMTLLNNVMTHLVKPTTEMKKFFDQLGVSSGEQAIQIYGFAGVLSKLEEASNGSSEKLAELFQDIRAIKGATVLAGDGLKDLKANIDYATGGQKRYDVAKSIAVESPGAQLLKQLEQVRNIATVDVATPLVAQILKVSNSLSDKGLAGIFQTVIDVGTPLLKLFLAYRVSLLALNGVSAVRAVVEKAQAATTLANAAAGQARVFAIHAEVKAQAQAIASAELRSLGLYEEARAAGVASLAESNLAASMHAVANSSKIATVQGTLFKSTLSGIGAIITNPAFLLTGVIAGVGYAISRYMDFSKEINDTYATGYQNALTYNQKITDAVEKSLADQGQAIERSLNRQFSAYQDFAAKVSSQIEKVVETQRQAATDQKNIVDEALRSYIKAYEDGTAKVEQLHRKTADAISKAEQDLDKNRADLAENQFKRQLKLAEHQDRQNAEGAKAVQSGQLNLINGEITRLRGENVGLAKPTGDPNKDLANREQMQKNIGRLDQLLNLQQDKRFQIEDERRRVVEQIAEIEKRITAEGETRAAQDQKQSAADQIRAARPNRGRTARSIGPLRDEEAQADASKRNIERSEQDRQQRDRLDMLNKQLAAMDAGLNILPDTNALQQQAVALEAEQNKLIKERLSLLDQQKLAQEKDIKNREKSFEGLKVAITDIEKFKFDPKNTINKPEDLNSQLAEFDRLVSKAQKAGLQDQSLITKIVQDRLAMEREGQAKILEAQQKVNIERLSADRKEIEARRTAQSQALKEQTQNVGVIAGKISNVVGGPTGPNGSFDQGPLGKSLGISEDVLGKLRELTNRIVVEQTRFAQGGAQVDPKAIPDLLNQIAALRTELNGETSVSGGTGGRGITLVKGKQTVISPGVDPVTGKPTQSKTGFDLLKEVEASAAELAVTVQKGQEAGNLLRASNRAIGVLETQLNGLQASYGQLNNQIANNSKSFQDLTGDVYKVITSMQSLKAQLDKLGQGTPASPQPSKRFALGGPVGTDTIVAAVSPGEYIVNARSTRKFYSQLVQMNRYADGGLVEYNSNIARPTVEMPVGSGIMSTTMHIGEINVHSVQNPKYDVRQIASELEREVRLGRANFTGNDQ